MKKSLGSSCIENILVDKVDLRIKKAKDYSHRRRSQGHFIEEDKKVSLKIKINGDQTVKSSQKGQKVFV